MDRENLRTHLIRGCALMCIEINSHQVEQLGLCYNSGHDDKIVL